MTAATSPPDGSVPALKEWGAVIAALLAGRQTVLLRKGGIHEKRFTLGRSRFLLYPTVAHSHIESTRPDHHDLLPIGARDVRLTPDGAPAEITVRAVADVAAAVVVERPENIAALEPFHVWTTDSIRRHRIDFRPRHQLTAVVVSVRPMLAPATLAVLPGYGGCRSWVDLQTAWDEVASVPVGDPVVGPSELAHVVEAVRDTVG